MIALQAPLLIALLAVAWLTAGGMAVRSVSRIWLRHWAERRLRGAGAAVAYLERPQRLLTAASIGVAATLLFAGMIIGASAVGLAVVKPLLTFTAIVILAGQLVPRAVARRWPSLVAPLALPVLEAADVVTSPFARLGAWFARPFARDAAVDEIAVNRDAIRDLLKEGELEGIGERDEIAIISGVVDFSDKTVAQVMRQREEIYALPASTGPRDFAREVAEAGYSRIPIYRGSVDDIFGMVHSFDVLKTLGEVVPPVRPVAFASPEAPCNELLFRMLRDRLHLAIVRDGHMRVVGLATLEDLLEELVGDIRDEHDDPAPPRQRGAA